MWGMFEKLQVVFDLLIKCPLFLAHIPTSMYRETQKHYLFHFAKPIYLKSVGTVQNLVVID